MIDRWRKSLYNRYMDEFKLTAIRLCADDQECLAAGKCPEPTPVTTGRDFKLFAETLGPDDRFCLQAERANQILAVRLGYMWFFWNLSSNIVEHDLYFYDPFDAGDMALLNGILADLEVVDPNPEFTGSVYTGSMCKNYPIWEQYQVLTTDVRQDYDYPGNQTTANKSVRAYTTDTIKIIPAELLPGDEDFEQITTEYETTYQDIDPFYTDKRIWVEGIEHPTYPDSTPEEVLAALEQPSVEKDYLWHAFKWDYGLCGPTCPDGTPPMPDAHFNAEEQERQPVFTLPLRELYTFSHPEYGQRREQQGFIKTDLYMVQIDFGQSIFKDYDFDRCCPPYYSYRTNGPRVDWATARAGMYSGDPREQPENSALAAKLVEMLEAYCARLNIDKTGILNGGNFNPTDPYKSYEVTIYQPKED